MKKFLLSIITFLYLAVSSGVAMEVHYCMGKRAGVELYKTGDNEKCGRCGMKDKKSGCCSDEHQFYKLSADAQKHITNDQQFEAPFVIIQQQHAVYNLTPLASLGKPALHNNSPPGEQDSPIYLLVRNFRL